MKTRITGRRTAGVLFLLTAFCALPRAPLRADAVKTFEAGFERIITNETGREVLRGDLYFTAPDTVFFEFSYPNKQLMIFKGQEITIYYPEKKKGYLLFSRQKQFATFGETFIGSLKNDFGLSDAGFTVSGSKIENGILFTYWTPPRSVKRTYGRMVVASKDGRPFYLEAVGPKGGTQFRITYDNFLRLGEYFFPSRVTIQQYSGTGPPLEVIEYSNQKINGNLPSRIMGFVVPADADMKKMQW